MKKALIALPIIGAALLSSCPVSGSNRRPFLVIMYLQLDESKSSYESSFSPNCQVIGLTGQFAESLLYIEKKGSRTYSRATVLTQMPPGAVNATYPQTIKVKTSCYGNVKWDDKGEITEKTKTGETTFDITVKEYGDFWPKLNMTTYSSENLSEDEKSNIKQTYNYTSTTGVWPVVAWEPLKK